MHVLIGLRVALQVLPGVERLVDLADRDKNISLFWTIDHATANYGEIDQLIPKSFETFKNLFPLFPIFKLLLSIDSILELK